jgi:hypothetical protein
MFVAIKQERCRRRAYYSANSPLLLFPAAGELPFSGQIFHNTAPRRGLKENRHDSKVYSLLLPIASVRVKEISDSMAMRNNLSSAPRPSRKTAERYLRSATKLLLAAGPSYQ